MLYEIGYVYDGEIVRGGIKAPISKVEEWIMAAKGIDSKTIYFAVPASEMALTEEECDSHISKKHEVEND